MQTDRHVRFADGFDRPERIALGLEAPQLAGLATAGLVAWWILHLSLPEALRDPLAALVGVLGVVVGWGRYEERTVPEWLMLAARYGLAPRRGGGAGARSLDGETLTAGGGEPVTAGGGGPVTAGLDLGASAGPDAGAPVLPEAFRGLRPARHKGTALPEPAPQSSRREAGTAPAWMRWLADEPAGGEADDPPGGEVDGTAVVVPVSASTLPAATGESGEGRAATPGSGDPWPWRGGRDRVVLLPSISGDPAEPDGDGWDDGWDDGLDGPEPGRGVAAVLPLPVSCVADRADAVPGEHPAPSRPPGPRAQERAYRVALFSLNGGSGRTTLAVELAGLCAARLRTAVVDLDPCGGDVGVRLGMRRPEPTAAPMIPGYHLGHGPAAAVDGRASIHASGLRVVLAPPGHLLGGARELDLASAAATLHELDCAGTELVVLDVAADLGPLATWALCAVDEIDAVLTPTACGIRDAYRCAEALSRLGLRSRLRWVVNRARGPVALDEMLGDLGGPLDGLVPEDGALVEAENHHLLAARHGHGAAVAALRHLAAALASRATSTLGAVAAAPTRG